MTDDARFVRVPSAATREQWEGLARDVFMWLDMNPPGSDRSGASLLRHFGYAGRTVPEWLREECAKGHLSKGDRAAIVYRLMVEAAAIATVPTFGRCAL